jgi:hypothetical protein
VRLERLGQLKNPMASSGLCNNGPGCNDFGHDGQNVAVYNCALLDIEALRRVCS